MEKLKVSKKKTSKKSVVVAKDTEKPSWDQTPAKFQLWSQDEYGAGSILGTFKSPVEAEKKAREIVNAANFDNALTSATQLNSIEAYMVEIQGSDETSHAFYASNRPDGKHRKYYTETTEGGITWELKVMEKNEDVRIYIGSIFSGKEKKEERIYLKDTKGKFVNSLTSLQNIDILRDKTIYFIRSV